jgi:hypothetical protein
MMLQFIYIQWELVQLFSIILLYNMIFFNLFGLPPYAFLKLLNPFWEIANMFQLHCTKQCCS